MDVIHSGLNKIIMTKSTRRVRLSSQRIVTAIIKVMKSRQGTKEEKVQKNINEMEMK